MSCSLFFFVAETFPGREEVGADSSQKSHSEEDVENWHDFDSVPRYLRNS